jgi:hypothetical protein
VTKFLESVVAVRDIDIPNVSPERLDAVVAVARGTPIVDHEHGVAELGEKIDLKRRSIVNQKYF